MVLRVRVLMKKITLFSLIMLITGSIDSIRNLPVTALFGANLIFFFVVGAIIFLIPSALVSAQLSVLWPHQGGIYHWVRRAFGPHTAALAVWLQWINTMVWFPTILSFIAGTLAFLVNPSLVHNRLYLLSVVLGVFWLVTLINMRGLQQSAAFASLCAVVGLLIPFALIIILGFVWVLGGHPMQIQLGVRHWLPHFSHLGSWVSLTGVVTAFLGMELATVHLGQIKQADRLFPRALVISVVLVLLIMIFGALVIAVVIPSTSISLVAGVMQTFAVFLRAYHMAWLIALMALFILIGSLGGMVNWLISPARGLLHAAEDGFLPPSLGTLNKAGVATRILWLQGAVVTFICMSMLLMPTVNGAYWLLTDLSTQLYLGMYVLMFIAALVLSRRQHSPADLLKLSGGRIGLRFICLLGLIGCAISMWVGFIPPQHIQVGGARHFELMFISGLVLMVLPVLLLWWQRSRSRQGLRG